MKWIFAHIMGFDLFHFDANIKLQIKYEVSPLSHKIPNWRNQDRFAAIWRLRCYTRQFSCSARWLSGSKWTHSRITRGYLTPCSVISQWPVCSRHHWKIVFSMMPPLALSNQQGTRCRTTSSSQQHLFFSDDFSAIQVSAPHTERLTMKPRLLVDISSLKTSQLPLW